MRLLLLMMRYVPMSSWSVETEPRRPVDGGQIFSTVPDGQRKPGKPGKTVPSLGIRGTDRQATCDVKIRRTLGTICGTIYVFLDWGGKHEA